MCRNSRHKGRQDIKESGDNISSKRGLDGDSLLIINSPKTQHRWSSSQDLMMKLSVSLLVAAFAAAIPAGVSADVSFFSSVEFWHLCRLWSFMYVVSLIRSLFRSLPPNHRRILCLFNVRQIVSQGNQRKVRLCQLWPKDGLPILWRNHMYPYLRKCRRRLS